MATMPNYFIGVDVSKNSLSVCVLFNDTINHFEIKNELGEIRTFFAIYANMSSFATFENTNTYNYDLMRAFDELGLPYSRLDAFKFSHFIKNQKRIKTDKSDAYLLALYGKKFYDELAFSSFSEDFALIKSYQSGLALINKINTQLANFKESLVNVNNDELEISMRELLVATKATKTKTENRVFDIVCELIPQTKQILAENKGIGKAFAVYVLPIIWLAKDKKAKEITSYMGIVPRPCESGSSIHGTTRISGGAMLARNTLYMCAMVLTRYNQKYVRLYQHHIASGKPKKKALIIVARKFVVHIKAQYFDEV